MGRDHGSEYPYVRASHGDQGGDVPDPTCPHLDHYVVCVSRCVQQRQRNTDLVVEGAVAGVHIPRLSQNRGQKVLS